MMRWWWIAALYVVALLVMLPAKLLYWLPLPANVSVNQVSGTVWQGHIGSMYVQGVPFKDVTWDLQLTALLTGNVAAAIRVPATDNSLAISAVLKAGFNELSVTNLRASGDLATLLHLANTRLPLTTRGNWQLRVPSFIVSDPSPTKWCNELNGSASGLGIQVLVNGVWQRLGDFPVDLGCTSGGAIAMQMADSNSLGLAFEGHINSQDIAIRGTVRPNPRTPEGLAKMFQYLGQPDAQGRYPFSF